MSGADPKKRGHFDANALDRMAYEVERDRKERERFIDRFEQQEDFGRTEEGRL